MLFTGIDSLDFPQSQIVDAKDIGTFLRYIIKTVTKRNLLTIWWNVILWSTRPFFVFTVAVERWKKRTPCLIESLYMGIRVWPSGRVALVEVEHWCVDGFSIRAFYTANLFHLSPNKNEHLLEFVCVCIFFLRLIPNFSRIISSTEPRIQRKNMDEKEGNGKYGIKRPPWNLLHTNNRHRYVHALLVSLFSINRLIEIWFMALKILG